MKSSANPVCLDYVPVNKTPGLEIVLRGQSQIFSPHLNTSSSHRICQAPCTHFQRQNLATCFYPEVQGNGICCEIEIYCSKIELLQRQEIQNCKMPKYELLMQFIFANICKSWFQG